MDWQAIREQLPFLQSAPAEVMQALQANGQVGRLGVGEFICWEGDQCGQLAIVLAGVARVYKVGENGREITLYRVEAGDSCILTASCILSGSLFPAMAVVEQAVTALILPAPLLRQWLDEYAFWRDYVFRLLAKRLALIIATVEEIAFQRVDGRLAAFLLASEPVGQPLSTTHQTIAYELGSAREVVSRLLKEFEREGLVLLARGTVTVVDATKLAARAGW